MVWRWVLRRWRATTVRGEWNRFIRPALVPRELALIPCHGNGCPGTALGGRAANCSERHMQHFWADKGLAERTFKEAALRLIRKDLLWRTCASASFLVVGG